MEISLLRVIMSLSSEEVAVLMKLRHLYDVLLTAPLNQIEGIISREPIFSERPQLGRDLIQLILFHVADRQMMAEYYSDEAAELRAILSKQSHRVRSLFEGHQ